MELQKHDLSEKLFYNDSGFDGIDYDKSSTISNRTLFFHSDCKSSLCTGYWFEEEETACLVNSV